MRLGNRKLAECQVTFCAGEFRVGPPRIDFKIDRAAIVSRRRRMTCRTRRNWYLSRQRICRVHRGNGVTRCARQVNMAKKLVPKRCGRISKTPLVKRDFIQNAYRGSKFGVKVRRRLLRFELVA